MDAKERRRKRDRERYAQMADEKREEKLKKRREGYQQKKEKICAQQRQIYAKMQPEQKKARIEHINELKRNTASKDSIALENPAYIATEKEVGTSTFPDYRKHVTPGERQTLLHRRNKEFTTRQRHVSSKQDVSMTETGDANTEPLQQPEEMIYGNTKFYTILAFKINIRMFVQLTIFYGQTSPHQCFQASKKQIHQVTITIRWRCGQTSRLQCFQQSRK
ncbi:hypothetical protein VPH35_076291 [Triticum aestivum]|uniref:Uncharacterized protein n=2 Tax=Aegilops tauschii subsp. strangulata TaxID=200361 RepID=A0A453H3N2_AEGTS